jgi:membrane fusion protein (multidrug efflux system)
MKYKIALAVVIVVSVVGAAGGIKALQIKKMIAAGESFVEPPESVATVVAREEKWRSGLSAIGSIVARQGVMITPEIAGLVREINFESGAAVEKGALLVRLDTSSEEAQLRAMDAQVELARVNLSRTESLKGKAVAQSELDTAEAALKQFAANADAIRVTIEKKTIRAPFAGTLGIRLVNLGQYLDAGKPIVSLQSLTPVYANFALPQQELSRLHTGMQVRVTTDTYATTAFAGTLTAINPDLDQSTRSVGLQATLDNQERLLRPGMFVRAEVRMPEEQSVLVIPATSVLSAPYGDSVYVVENSPGKDGSPGLTVHQQFIRTGAVRGDYVSVESGLKPGERVVSAGLFKLRNGMRVVENNQLVPKANEAPRPSDS